jgi:hypothetical protein
MRSPRSGTSARFGQRGQFLAVQAGSSPHLRAFGQQAHQRQRGDRLAAARLADQPERLPAAPAQRHTAQRRQRAARGDAA